MDSNFLDREFVKDISRLRIEFQQIDIFNIESLRKWFTDHAYLSDNEHARISRRTAKTIQRWRQRCGVKPTIVRTPPTSESHKLSDLIAPPDWDIEWVVGAYVCGHGIRPIAKAVGRSYIWVHRKIKKAGVLRSQEDGCKSKHQCNNRPWLVDNYVTKKKTIPECASLAGVSFYTISSWLIAQRIRIRASEERHGTALGTSGSSDDQIAKSGI